MPQEHYETATAAPGETRKPTLSDAEIAALRLRDNGHLLSAFVKLCEFYGEPNAYWSFEDLDQ